MCGRKLRYDIINLELRKYIECTYEEKQPLLKLISEIIHLANFARIEGVLGLEQRLEELDDDLLKLGLALIIDGTDPELVEEIIETYITTSFKTGAELLSQLIVRYGVLYIQNGYNPKIIEAQLKALLGDGFLNQEICIELSDKKLKEEYETLMADLEHWEPAEGLPEFEALINFSSHDMQAVFKGIDRKELCIALRGASLELKKYCLHNLSKNMCIQILNDMKFSGPIGSEDISNAQQNIVNILRRFQEIEDIFFTVADKHESPIED